YLSRCSYLLRQGNFVGDVLLYYGDDAPNLVPPKRIDPNIKPLYDDSKCLHCGLPKSVNPGDLAGYDYDYVNAEIIATTLNSENGKLVLPHGQSYRVMLIPDRKDISLEVLKSLEKLISDGAVIIGPKPERSTSLKDYPNCDTEVKTIADKIWGKCDGKTVLSNQYGKGTVYWGKTVAEVLDELKIAPDFDVKGIDNCDHHIDYIHRQTAEDDIYFVSNSSLSAQNFTAVFRVNSLKVPELWDAETGLVQRDVKYSKTESGISIELVMDALASRFVVFRNSTNGKNDTGLTYNLQYGFRAADNPASVDISDNWELSFAPEMGGPEHFRMDKLMSWSEVENEGVKYYSGKARYKKEFEVKEQLPAKGQEAYVVFDDIQEMARVWVNDQDCGIVWTPPYKANITKSLKPGKNTITVEVVNTWNNRIVGDIINPAAKQYTRTNIKYKFKADKPLLKSGLMGKAEIILIKNSN
ncbi:MAG TPA: glycosyl hydrolase, partial [Bacteroidales bacterium]|nr:glycosyl hydrolase [Bacteroidales bacterium]